MQMFAAPCTSIGAAAAVSSSTMGSTATTAAAISCACVVERGFHAFTGVGEEQGDEEEDGGEEVFFWSHLCAWLSTSFLTSYFFNSSHAYPVSAGTRFLKVDTVKTRGDDGDVLLINKDSFEFARETARFNVRFGCCNLAQIANATMFS